MKKLYTKKDLKRAYDAGADKKTWSEITLNGVADPNNTILMPIFKNWFNSNLFKNKGGK